MNDATSQPPFADAHASRPEVAPLCFGMSTNADKRWFLAVFTLILWLGCATVTVLGFTLTYALPHSSEPKKIMQVELLNVELGDNSPIQPEQPKENPAPPETVIQPPDPQPVSVVQYSPAIAFALPVEGPLRIVNAHDAVYSLPVASVVNAAPLSAPQALAYGQGEGKQPKPEYPDRAKKEGQEGTVVIRLAVGEDGRVANAEITAPSQWPLLNESALSAVKKRWRFPRGDARVYEVPIRFELTR